MAKASTKLQRIIPAWLPPDMDYTELRCKVCSNNPQFMGQVKPPLLAVTGQSQGMVYLWDAKHVPEDKRTGDSPLNLVQKPTGRMTHEHPGRETLRWRCRGPGKHDCRIKPARLVGLLADAPSVILV